MKTSFKTLMLASALVLGSAFGASAQSINQSSTNAITGLVLSNGAFAGASITSGSFGTIANAATGASNSITVQTSGVIVPPPAVTLITTQTALNSAPVTSTGIFGAASIAPACTAGCGQFNTIANAAIGAANSVTVQLKN
jgi:hypothetical protein